MTTLTSRLRATRPTISQLWTSLAPLPGGRQAFSRMVGMMAPYTGNIKAEVLTLEEGHAEVRMQDRRAVRNHLDCVHAIALMNLGELCTGLTMLYPIDGRGRGIIKKLSMEYYKKARGPITASCWANHPVRPGDHELDVTAELRDESGQVVAKAFAVWKVTID